MHTAGLYGHIQRNAAKSAVLLALFAVLGWVLWFALILLYHSLTWWSPDVGLDQRAADLSKHAFAYAASTWWIAAIATTLWLGIGLFTANALIRMATGARPLERRQNQRLFNIVETLAIEAGLPTPHIEIIPSAQLNAYASGLTPHTATVAVTSGLLEELHDDELAAVIAHEITHIRNRDVSLMVIASVLAGGLSIISAGLFSRRDSGRALDGDADFLLPAIMFCGLIFLLTSVISACVIIGAVGAFALAAKFAISRSREFVADAGAVELTRNPDALIAALRKISGRDSVPVASPFVGAMMISWDAEDWFATHPSIEERIDALTRHAGGVERPLKPRDGIRRFGRWGHKGRAGLSNGRSTPIRG